MATSRSIVGRVMFWATLGCITLACLTYLTDLAILRWRFAAKRSPTRTVVVKQYFAVPRKDHKTEFMNDDPRSEVCVNSLYPHAGASPCWYLVRHAERRIDL